MQTEVDLTRLTPRQREVLTSLARRLSKNEVERLLHLVETMTGSVGVISKAVKQAIDRANAVIEESERNRAA